MHLAGHAIVATSSGAELRIDDHGDYVCAGVWSLYERAVGHFGVLPTLLEWDTRLPEFAVLQGEAAQAQMILNAAEVEAASQRQVGTTVAAARASHAHFA